MYTSYSTLQRKQLSKQAYTDTQSTYLLVYAPGRHKALETALQNQLHRKFRLVTALEGELTPDVAGVLLVSEDVECIPTALTYFAAALREGADLAVCDASFGFDGSTALYLSTRHLPGSSCAIVSRALLDKVRAAARGRDSVTELLRLSHAMAQHSCCIPQALLHFRRELCAEDVFSAKGRRALILSHELTMTGAPILSPQIPYYINRKQSKLPTEPMSQGHGTETVEAVYNYQPLKDVDAALQPYYKGVQANFWTEWVTEPSVLEYLMLPRLAAVAEAGWTPQEKRNYEDFKERIRKDAELYDLKGWNYGKHIMK